MELFSYGNDLTGYAMVIAIAKHYVWREKIHVRDVIQESIGMHVVGGGIEYSVTGFLWWGGWRQRNAEHQSGSDNDGQHRSNERCHHLGQSFTQDSNVDHTDSHYNVNHNDITNNSQHNNG